LLSPEVSSQIAAGEVVERPASVVKELLENALDAGARHISITVEGAGKRLIEVADDGCGIPTVELTLAVARHATSKLNSAADLFRIATLGFRGEALASIGSVARLTLTSRPAEAAVGGQLRLEGGVAGEVQPVGVPVGTAARVENLFFNIPARLKFLKSDLTERRAIDDLVTRYALAYPQVRFHLQQENHPSLQTSGNGNRREILAALYGVEVAQQLLEVLADYDVVRINGYISPISLTRSNRREITFFVNGRWVHDAALTTALVQAYHTQLMVGRYPLAVLFLDLPPEMVDVNVHPAKAEVRFRDRDSVFSGVQRAVRRALLAYTPVPGLEAELLTPPQIPSFPPSQPSSAPAPFLPITPPPQLPASPTPLLRLVGQIASTYLVAEGPDGLYLIDQHAAHERVLFEKLMMQHAGGEEGENKIPTQSLLQPATVELPPAGARLLANQLPLLARLGFQVEPFGPTTFLVRAIPALLSGADPVAALRVIVEDFEEDETPLQAELEARLIARVCKRAAVKAGQTLSPAEQHALLDGLESCSSPRTCPHGRPTMIHLSVDLLERQFGRRGAR
jgi:DNA mismatch repair protein MutL